MTATRYRVEPLGNEHNRAAFACGNETLDRYFRERAGQDRRRGVARVFVMLDTHDGSIAGFYTLSANSVRLGSLPAQVANKLGRYPDVPVILIGRLALDRRYQGAGLGRVLLGDALLKAHASTETVTAFAVIVDAEDDDARTFYERNGFQRVVDDEYRLFISMSDIGASLP